jgi:ribosomal protein S18 acetylase RimI-like enzyme
MDIIYRTGRKGDSLRLAELLDIASGGVMEYLFHDLIPGLTPLQIVAHNLESDNYRHSYKSAIVAEHDKMIVGMALSYPSHLHKITEEMRAFFPQERLEHIKSFYSVQVENSLFLDALCVSEESRGKGIGSELISLTKKKAREKGYDILSVIVFADNAKALHLYQRTGFEVVQKVELKSNEFIPHEGGCLLMTCKAI